MVVVLFWWHEKPLFQKVLPEQTQWVPGSEWTGPWFQKFPWRGPTGEKGGLLQLPRPL